MLRNSYDYRTKCSIFGRSTKFNYVLSQSYKSVHGSMQSGVFELFLRVELGDITHCLIRFYSFKCIHKERIQRISEIWKGIFFYRCCLQVSHCSTFQRVFLKVSLKNEALQRKMVRLLKYRVLQAHINIIPNSHERFLKNCKNAIFKKSPKISKTKNTQSSDNTLKKHANSGTSLFPKTLKKRDTDNCLKSH